MTEEWREIPGFGGHYEASDQGRIRMKARIAMRTLNGRPNPLPMSARIRKPSKGNKHGHLKLSIGVDGKTYKKWVHHLVLLAFVGPRPDGMQGCHRNDIPDDNRPGNLRWDTQASNMADRGPPRRPYPKGAAHVMAKLDDERVRAIKGRSTERAADLAAAFGVSLGTIKKIRSGKHWGHISP